jgi:hypothetical protein
MEAQRAGYIPFKASNANPHVGWITHFLQQRSKNTNKDSRQNNSSTGGKKR